MKISVNVAFVLFMLLGVGLVYAGKGVCVTPEDETESSITREDYPSGQPKYTSHTRSYYYFDGSCVGDEGTCETTTDENAIKSKIIVDEWWYNDDILSLAIVRYKCYCS